MEGLAQIDGWTVAAILAKALGYGAALLAMGGPLFVAAFPLAAPDVRRFAIRIAVVAAVLLIAVLALRFGIRAARISGMGLPGMVDPMMLAFVWDSPLGTAAPWRGAGVVLVLGLLVPGLFGRVTALFGPLLIAISYTSVGHSLGEPRWLLAALLVLHLLAAAFWVGALAPLHHAAVGAEGAALLHRFGKAAAMTVPLLIIVGSIFAWIMTGSLSALFATAYGWTLIAKLTFVSGLLGLAGLNKWRLVPALADDRVGASDSLRRSIVFEATAVFLILLTTATLTTVTTPPINL
ncbi:MAG: CopD family protein [Ascidiaceihabitans sp.]|uniref:CopD family protein n=1 Tax=Rhodobacterales TaxID=204455 RepID=UPI003297D382